MNVKELTEKARKFCAYRERCTREVEDKLRRMGAGRLHIAQVKNTLQEEGFLDDKRYAEVFSRGKFRNNQWGKVKIKAALAARHIPDDHIRNALDAIDADSYQQTLEQLITKKISELEAKNKDEIKARTAAYCIRKGYEAELVWHALHRA